MPVIPDRVVDAGPGPDRGVCLSREGRDRRRGPPAAPGPSGARVPALVGALVAVALAVAVAPPALVAQLPVEGRVLDRELGTPLAAIEVAVPSEGMVVATDSAGAFRFEVPADRPGVTLAIDVPGYEALHRTWILPLDDVLTIAMDRIRERGVGEPGPIDDAVFERMDRRIERVDDVRVWVADMDQLRSYVRQQSEPLRALVDPLSDLGIPCEACATLTGSIGARLTVDEEVVPLERFRGMRIAELCRIEVVRLNTPVHPNIRIVGGAAGIHAYTCGYLAEVSAGRQTLPAELEPWFSHGGGG